MSRPSRGGEIGGGKKTDQKEGGMEQIELLRRLRELQPADFDAVLVALPDAQVHVASKSQAGQANDLVIWAGRAGRLAELKSILKQVEPARRSSSAAPAKKKAEPRARAMPRKPAFNRKDPQRGGRPASGVSGRTKMINEVIRGRVLFLGAHCDDIEIGCGGTAAKLKAEGRTFAFAIATDCGDGRSNEARTAAARLGLGEDSGTLFLGLIPDGRLAERTDVLAAWIKEVVRRFRPDTVFLQHPDTHSDHATLYQVAIRVFNRQSILTFPIPKLISQRGYFDPNTHEDISSFMDEKLALCACHALQFGKDVYLDPEQLKATALTAYNSHFGGGNGYAEAFHIHVNRSAGSSEAEGASSEPKVDPPAAEAHDGLLRELASLVERNAKLADDLARRCGKSDRAQLAKDLATGSALDALRSFIRALRNNHATADLKGLMRRAAACVLVWRCPKDAEKAAVRKAITEIASQEAGRNIRTDAQTEAMVEILIAAALGRSPRFKEKFNGILEGESLVRPPVGELGPDADAEVLAYELSILSEHFRLTDLPKGTESNQLKAELRYAIGVLKSPCYLAIRHGALSGQTLQRLHTELPLLLTFLLREPAGSPGTGSEWDLSTHLRHFLELTAGAAGVPGLEAEEKKK